MSVSKEELNERLEQYMFAANDGTMDYIETVFGDDQHRFHKGLTAIHEDLSEKMDFNPQTKEIVKINMFPAFVTDLASLSLYVHVMEKWPKDEINGLRYNGRMGEGHPSIYAETLKSTRTMQSGENVKKIMKDHGLAHGISGQFCLDKEFHDGLITSILGHVV